MTKPGRKWLGIVLALQLTLVPCACTRHRSLTPPRPHPVQGRLTWHGEPVRWVIVNLEPADGRGAEADGVTDEDGRFELRSFANDGTMDGLLAPARYRVNLEVLDPTRFVARKVPRTARPTPLPFEDWDTGVTVEVNAGDAELAIELP